MDYPNREVEVLLDVYERLMGWDLQTNEIETALAKKLMDLLLPEHYLRFVSPGEGRSRIRKGGKFEAYVFGKIVANAEDIVTLLTAFVYTKPGSEIEKIVIFKIRNMIAEKSIQMSDSYLKENAFLYSSNYLRYKKLLEDLL